MKKPTKRLALATQTIRVLQNDDLQSVVGGSTASGTSVISQSGPSVISQSGTSVMSGTVTSGTSIHPSH
jgi:hypothetical protein